MVAQLVLTIRLHDDRYHGAPAREWPPAPARAFQALVAGSARGRNLPPQVCEALAWLESLPPPVIAAPFAKLGARLELFVPNNDADSVDGVPERISEIRTKKSVEPHLLEGDGAFTYAWAIDGDAPYAQTVIEAAEELYQFGRGVDMAWASAELVPPDVLEARLIAHEGTIHRPHGTEGGTPLPCPTPGSLASLIQRHLAVRLRSEGVGKGAVQLFTNAPKPRFAQVAYASAGGRYVYELRPSSDESSRLWPWPVDRSPELVERLRDAAAARLADALPNRAAVIERTLVGRKADGNDAGPIAHRIRIVPLPSIGHEHVEPAIRRVLVEVPSGCPLRPDDVDWSFTGLETHDATTGEVGPFVLQRAADMVMAERYLGAWRRWRSITPVALPMEAARRRIEPARQVAEAKGAAERIAEEQAAARAVATALRHAGVSARIERIVVQREPLHHRGRRAEAFAVLPRFAKERLWHVDVTLDRLVDGPLLLGDGRFLGLGLMTPVPEDRLVFGFALEGVVVDDPVVLGRALRRAVMARVADATGTAELSRFFSGHEQDGRPAQADWSSHLAFQAAPDGRRVYVIAPCMLDFDGHTRRLPSTAERKWIDVLARALEGFATIRVGRPGSVRLRPVDLGDDPHFGASRVWESSTPYAVNRHGRGSSAAHCLEQDVLAECRLRGLPAPRVDTLEARAGKQRGLRGRVRLTFPVAIQGPLVLGRSRYLGGGLFRVAPAVTP